jgi:hypothetical protein
MLGAMASARRATASSRGASTRTRDRDSSHGSNEGRRSGPYGFADEDGIDSHELGAFNGSADSGGPRRRERFSHDGPTGNATSSIDRASQASGSQATGLAGLDLHGDIPRPLNWQDVAALIINKMVGTGIYTTPSAVLLLTRSKGEALGLWIIGFVYTLIAYEPSSPAICHT